MTSTSACFTGILFSASRTVCRCCQFCIAITSAWSITSNSMEARKSAAPGPPSLSFVARPSGDATSMSDPKKSTYSRTEAFVTLIPSRKWSSVFPLNIAEWSSGTQRFFLRRFSVSAASPSESKPKSSANRSNFETASARPCAAGQSSSKRRTTFPATLRMGTKMRTVARANPWSRGTSSWTITRFFLGATLFVRAEAEASAFAAAAAVAVASRSLRASRSARFFASRAASSALARRSSASLFFVMRLRVRVTCATAWSR
mmetsp:Transcript_1385/g.5769  ORF Transcript_1385/g.5769 Transcript_1385/m.5769 type:complete len:260 (+) Transcript_1385:850-1629(+)